MCLISPRELIEDLIVVRVVGISLQALQVECHDFGLRGRLFVVDRACGCAGGGVGRSIADLRPRVVRGRRCPAQARYWGNLCRGQAAFVYFQLQIGETLQRFRLALVIGGAGEETLVLLDGLLAADLELALGLGGRGLAS